MYLHEAQEDLEEIIQYPIGKKWFSYERHKPKTSILTKFGKIIASGIQATTNLSLAATVDLTVDPCVITINPIAQPSDYSEIHVFHPATDVEIIFSNILWDAVNGLRIYVPKCRLIATAYEENPPEGWVYSDNTHFEATVDVKRIYNDPTTQARLVYRKPLTDFDQELYKVTDQYIQRADIGLMEIKFLTSDCCNDYEWLDVNYCAGTEEVSRSMENAIIRLAHSKMATEPCGCDITQRMWKRDRFVPEILTRERINCPFGMSDGAWYAWKWANNKELVRSSPLISHRDF